MNIISGIIILLAFIAIALRLFNFYEIFLLDNDSARYFLSTVAQSLATIFALVVTASFIILQLLIQSYTYETFELFFKRWEIIFLGLLYLVTIAWSIGLILRLSGEVACTNQGICVDIIFVLSLACIAGLVPYIHELLEILKPKVLLGLMETELNKGTRTSEMMDRISEVGIVSIRKSEISVTEEVLNIFDRVREHLSAESQGVLDLDEKLEGLFRVAVEVDSPPIIWRIVEVSIHNPARNAL